MLTTYKSIVTALTLLLTAPVEYLGAFLIYMTCSTTIHSNSTLTKPNPSFSTCFNSLPNPPLITSGCIDIPYSNNVRSLGVHFISTFSMISHITNMHKSIHYHLHCLRTFCKSVPLENSIIITSSYILPNFDYCNNLLFNLPIYNINKLQTLQNAVARFVF